jgi:predicted unusual protein kinase regulating ubiquinone biosynthesis (AarF/ABC1/UbiB family)
MLPLRLSRGWDDIRAKLDEVTRILELETDYETEARTLTQARTLFHEDDGIVIPRVFPQYSTPRILTMDYIDGEHVAAFMAQNPSQELRDQFGRKIYVSQMRMDGARMLYADPHPGNFIFLEDGRLGLIDFGCVRPYSDSEWQYYRSIKVSPSRDELVDELRKAEGRSKDEPIDPALFEVFERLYHWTQEPVLTEGPFDFGDTQKLRIGFDCLAEATRQRYTRGKPMFLFTYRCFLGVRAMLYRLRARVDAKKIFEQEYNW